MISRAPRADGVVEGGGYEMSAMLICNARRLRAMTGARLRVLTWDLEGLHDEICSGAAVRKATAKEDMTETGT